MGSFSSLREGDIREFRTSSCYLQFITQNPAIILAMPFLPLRWEMKGLRFVEYPRDLTEADRLNGVKAGCYVVAKCDALRIRTIKIDIESPRSTTEELSDWTDWVDEQDAFAVLSSAMTAEGFGTGAGDLLIETSEGTAIEMVDRNGWKVRTKSGTEIDFPAGLFRISPGCGSIAKPTGGGAGGTSKGDTRPKGTPTPPSPSRPDTRTAPTPNHTPPPKPAAPGVTEEPGLKVRVGDTAPDFSLLDVSGRKVTLSSFSGKVVVIEFWAMWCGPCRKSLPLLQKFAEDMKSNDKVVVLPINVWEQEKGEALRNKVRDWWDRQQLTMRVVLDPEAKLIEQFGFGGIPACIVIGPDGKLVSSHLGYSANIGEELAAQVNKALSR